MNCRLFIFICIVPFLLGFAPKKEFYQWQNKFAPVVGLSRENNQIRSSQKLLMRFSRVVGEVGYEPTREVTHQIWGWAGKTTTLRYFVTLREAMRWVEKNS
jgi:hypothetical protein